MNRNQILNGMFGFRANGGPGSGNFGHSGRPGEVGGSAGEGGDSGSNKKSEERQLYDHAIAAVDHFGGDWGKRTVEGVKAALKNANDIVRDHEHTGKPYNEQHERLLSYAHAFHASTIGGDSNPDAVHEAALDLFSYNRIHGSIPVPSFFD